MKDAELAILSIIAEAPITGYDLQNVIDERNLRMWTLIGVESIYYVLEKLDKQGLIECINNETVETAQKLYRVTGAGMGILQTVVMDLLSNPYRSPQNLDLGLANLPVLKTSQVRHALSNYHDSLKARHRALSRQLEKLRTMETPFHIISMFKHQLAILKADIEWFEQWIPEWEVQAPPDKEEPPLFPLSSPPPRMQQRIMPDDPDFFHKHPTRVGKAVDAEKESGESEDVPPWASAKTKASSPTDKLPPDKLPPANHQDKNSS